MRPSKTKIALLAGLVLALTFHPSGWHQLAIVDRHLMIKDASLDTKIILYEEPNLINIPNALILHMGKAGGTTVKRRTREQWKILIDEAHLKPSQKRKRGKPNLYLLPTLRDPVDRYVSAFYWRIERLSHDIPKHERVYGNTSGCQTWNKPSPALIDMLYHRRQKNASALAIDLCSTNETIAQQALRDLYIIQHVKANQDIVGWFHFDWKSKANKIYPLILEKDALDLNAQIDAAVHWLYDEIQFEDLPSFQNRSHFVHQSDGLKNVQEQHYRSSSNAKQPLTPVAEQCMVKFYRKDYEMLATIRDELCKTLSCRQAINKILGRRKALLENSSLQVKLE